MTGADALIRDLLDRSRISGLIGPSSWSTVQRAFPGLAFERWIDIMEGLIDGGLGSTTVLNFVQATPSVARQMGIEAALAVGKTARQVAASAGSPAAAALIASSTRAAGQAANETAFRTWLEVLATVAEQAPAAVPPLLHRTELILSVLGPGALRSWVMVGLRLTAGHPERSVAYFSLADADSLRLFEHESGNVVLATVERRLRHYLSALWGIRPFIRATGQRTAVKPVRRASFDGFVIRMPDHYPGFSGQQAARLFHAAVAHIGAHMVFTPQRFPVRSLKPLQVALISLIEDARVEALAGRRFPGLTRLWRSFHVAEPEGPLLALPLVARLARALIDPDYDDPDPWVRKGRAMFNDEQAKWEDPAISREIGGLLGNDLGQMRVQFNPKTYVVEPAYRDDNLGIWDMGQPDAPPSEETDVIEQGVRISRTEQEPEPDQRSRTERDEAANARAVQLRPMEEDTGIPVARYGEWDYVTGSERLDWVTVQEFEPRSAPARIIDRVLAEYPDALYRIRRLIKSARVSRPSRLRRQPEGERLDLEASIQATIDRRTGVTPDTRVYETMELKHRDLSVLLLLDISESTKDTIRGTSTSVFSIEIAATALVAEAMKGLDDPFAISAFCSNGRDEVRYYRVKDFEVAYGEQSKSRLAGLRGGLSTRMGAALRHAGHELAQQQTFRRLLLIVTDGEPSDTDVSDRRYLVEDARKAVQSLAHEGIDVFCVGLDSGGDSYLSRIFGRRNVIQIDKVTALPEKLPMLYLRLAA
jgi:nitric oxide reductase NorD protein